VTSDKTILVVDDEPDVLSTIVRMLDRTKTFHVLRASDHEEAFQQIAACGRPVDLAILDIALESKSGIELAADLQSLHPQTKVLFISGWTGAELLNYCGIPIEDNRFLAKPFTYLQLMGRVNEILTESPPKTQSANSSLSA